ncbi:MAG: AMP-binding protein, partial [Gammaproteobacteria bacterium]|nr:AMP-binding protein [Gammaproteobacteria bacterium]
MTEPVATVYPKNALQGRDDLDVITPDVAPTLDALFRVRVQRSFEKTAYTEFDEGSGQWRDYTWAEIAAEVKRWQAALEAEGLKKGDRIALRLKNCRHWVIFDQAALGLGLVVVPLYVADRPDNVNYVLENSDSKLLFVENLQAWQELREAGADKLPDLQRVVVRNANSGDDTRVESMEDWLDGANQELRQELTTPEDLASIVYTSGTT